jgi:hypothetical protein
MKCTATGFRDLANPQVPGRAMANDGRDEGTLVDSAGSGGSASSR